VLEPSRVALLGAASPRAAPHYCTCCANRHLTHQAGGLLWRERESLDKRKEMNAMKNEGRGKKRKRNRKKKTKEREKIKIEINYLFIFINYDSQIILTII
jgi:hypothetical protein